ncbi:MAG TPA: HD domain-containing protein, partial [Candidatus Limnocylindrales bacterium]
MAHIPLPGTELSDPEDLAGAIPEPVHHLLRTLWGAGHAAYVVGGALRDALLGRTTTNWDLATAALPEQTAALFEDAAYENRFGTVVLRRDGHDYEITTFRTDHDYADFRRPHRVEFGSSLEADLARRDFTMNALAWGAPDTATGPRLVDPHEGRADLAEGVIRAVGEPDRRFEEDALRMLRAVRFAATLEFQIEPATLAAIRRHAPLVAHLSGERIAVELGRILAVSQPSRGLRLLAETGILEHVAPELAAQRGVPQNKIPGEDLWDHTLRTVDSAANRPVVRLAALLHDIGKPATAADGHFYHHDTVGADLAEQFLDRLHLPRTTAERVVHLVRQHMFRYEANWGDAA